MVLHVPSVILHHTIASSSNVTRLLERESAIVCRDYTLEYDVPA